MGMSIVANRHSNICVALIPPSISGKSLGKSLGKEHYESV